MRQVVAFRKVPWQTTALGGLTKCPQRLVKGTDKLFMNAHICNKHLSAADTKERILNSTRYIPPRKVRNKVTFEFKIYCTLHWDLNCALKLNSNEPQSTHTILKLWQKTPREKVEWSTSWNSKPSGRERSLEGCLQQGANKKTIPCLM